jgi:glycine/D-amino acid oxidase-like deaminating enzyme
MVSLLLVCSIGDLVLTKVGGHLRPSVYARLSKYIDEFGIEAAVEVADFEFNHIQAIADLVEKEKIDCDFKLTRSYDIYTEQDSVDEARRSYDELKSAGVAKTTIDDLIWWEGEEAKKVFQIQSSNEFCKVLILQASGVKNCIGCFSSAAGQLWPYKLMLHLLQRAVSSGCNLQTHTPVTSISQLEGQWIATTPRGVITACKVIFATNGYTAGLLPEYKSKIVPSKGMCCRIVCPPGKPCPPIKTTSYILRLPNGSGDYMIQRQDGSIVVGGARSDFFKDFRNWYDIVDDSTLIEPAKHYFDTYMQDHFIGWEDSGAYVDQIWTGIMGYTSDSLPSIGQVPGKEGCYIAAGFEGHGMPVIWLAMKGVASMIMGKSFEESGIPKIFKATKERLASNIDLLRSSQK